MTSQSRKSEGSRSLPQIEAMRMGASYKFVAQLREFKVNLRPLTQSENVQVTAEAIAHIQSLESSLNNRLTESTLIANKTLQLASTSAPKANDPTLTELLLSEMTNDEIIHLYNQWLHFCEKVNPSFDTLSQDEVKALIEEVKKKPNLLSHLTGLSFKQLVSLAHYSLTLPNSQTDS